MEKTKLLKLGHIKIKNTVEQPKGYRINLKQMMEILMWQFALPLLWKNDRLMPLCDMKKKQTDMR